MKQVHQGAEAIIYEDAHNNIIIKDRISKNYRIKELDISIRKFRTKREDKVLRKLEELGVSVPKLLRVDDFTIVMENIKGAKLKDVLINYDIKDSDCKKNCKKYFQDLGRIVAKMHSNSIIHSDLTTSNIIIDKSGDLVMIDFGLSFFSQKVEDMAVDIHLFKETLSATHPDFYDIAFKEFLRGYNFSLSEKVIKRLDIVESRGRYKQDRIKKSFS